MQSKEVIARCLAACPRAPEIPPGLFVRWYKKVGDDLFEILDGIYWSSVNNPVAYVGTIVRDWVSTPDYEVRTSAGERIVLVREEEGVRILREDEAEDFLGDH